MAIRRPSVYQQSDFAFQDFLSHDNGTFQLRYLLIKHDGESFHLVKETFDSNPPVFQGGPVIGRIDYNLSDHIVEIYHWEVYWKDEWPLRLGVQYLVHCLYTSSQGFSVIVDKEQYPFWVSENFFPTTNSPNHYLMQGF